MSYSYTALVSYFDSDDRLVNLTQAATVTAYNALTGDIIPGATITNIRVGVYRVAVTYATLTDVLFVVVPHLDDQADHPDVPLMQEKVYHVADDMPASVWAYTTRTLTSFGTLIADIWGYATRTLTQSATSVIAAVSGSSITDIRGNTWSIELPGLTLDPHLIQFVIKRQNRDADKRALLMINTATGLLYVNGEVASNPAKASLSYVDTTLTITVKADITAQLPVGSWYYGIQSIATNGTVAEIYGGVFVVTADIVRGVSG